ncbi:MAG: ABC transporter ATP-binding protein [Candidatus Limnocylindria bacterium]
MTGGPPVLEATGIEAGYTDVNILHGVHVTVPEGAIVAIVGPNGAGKSTLLKAIYGLVRPRAGRVVLRHDGQETDITGLAPHRITALGMNYVPQLQNVFPGLSVRENLEMGTYRDPRRFRERSETVHQLFPILRERARQAAGTLSAGQRQMVAFARALMSGPRVLLLDEPSAGLAPIVVDEVFDTIGRINATGIAILIVEQNARRSLAMAQQAYVLDMGRDRFEGTGTELLADPRVLDLYLGGRGRLSAHIDEDYEATPEPE